MVVAGRSSGGEGIIEPEAVLIGDAIRRVGERGRPLVGGHHEVGVVSIVPPDSRWRNDRIADPVVGHVEKAAHEPRVGSLDFVEGRGELGSAFDDEPSLRAGRHDDDVLRHLRLHEAQHLGPIILPPIRPAKAAPGDHPAPEVDPLDVP